MTRQEGHRRKVANEDMCDVRSDLSEVSDHRGTRTRKDMQMKMCDLSNNLSEVSYQPRRTLTNKDMQMKTYVT